MDECDECRVASSAKDRPFELMNNSVCIRIHSDPAEWKFRFPAKNGKLWSTDLAIWR